MGRPGLRPRPDPFRTLFRCALAGLVFLAAASGRAQQSAADSARAQHATADSVRRFEALPDTTKVRQLAQQAWQLRRLHAADAVTVGKRALDLAQRIGFRAGEAEVLNYIGVAYQWLGANTLATDYFFRALGVADSAGALTEKGYALNNISALYLIDGDGAQALTFAQRAVAAAEQTQDRRLLAYTHIRLGEVDNSLQRYDDAIVQARESYQLWIELHEMSTGMSALRSVALAYEGKQQYQLALSQMLAIISSDSIAPLVRLHDLNDLARLYLRVHQPDKAIETGLRKIAAGEGDAEIMGYVAEAYAAKGNWQSAYTYATRQRAMQDSVVRLGRTQQLNNLHVVYETALKDQDNRLLRRQLRLSWYLAAATGLAVLLLALFGVTLRGRRRQQEQVNLLLSRQLAQIRASEAALAEGSRQQRAILDNVPDAMWVKDTAGRYTAVNERFGLVFKRPVAEITGQTVTDLLPPDEARQLLDQEASAIAARAPRSAEREVVIDGITRVMDTTVSPVFDTDGQLLGTTGISRDVTDRKRAEARMHRAQKLESLGVLAGGIAHDFNNLLTGILGNAALIREDLLPNSESATSIDEIERAALRAAELSQKMLAYTGKSHLDRQRLDLTTLIQKMTPTLRSAISDTASLRTDLATTLPAVLADEIQIAQVVMSLVINASEALGDAPGTITLRTRRVRISGSQAATLESPEALTEGEYVVLEVLDTGHGMSHETQARIFDPFFSTKFTGRGLGLAAAVGIVRGHHGAIQLQSELGQGSKFDLYLPAAGDWRGAPLEATPLPTSRPAEQTTDRGAGTILVVDDEPAVRQLVQRVVERAGFNALTAADGIEAIEMVRQHSATISLVVLDLLMPRMGGEGALRAIRQMVPDLPIVLSSGFDGDAVADDVLKFEFVVFLRKPYRSQDLITTIRDLLARRAEAPAVEAAPMPS